MSTQQEKLRQLAEITAKNKAEIERTVYYDDFVKAFQSLMEFVDKAKNSLEETANNRSRQIDAELDKALKEINTKAETLSNLHQKAANDLKSDQRTFQRYIDEKLREVNDNLPDDYDDQELRTQLNELQTAFNDLVIPDQFDATELTNLVDKHTEEIEELKKRPTGTGGGGVSNARIQQAFKYILKTEAPVGDINGVNTSYTVSQPIFAVLAISLNGETIAQLPNYTISGKTITFSSALPSVYSGKDFEIKYI